MMHLRKTITHGNCMINAVLGYRALTAAHCHICVDTYLLQSWVHLLASSGRQHT